MLKYVPKVGIIPFLECEFEVLDFMLKLEHFQTCQRYETIPTCGDQILEIRVRKPEGFKMKWSLVSCFRS